jgi:hypothetical protein
LEKIGAFVYPTNLGHYAPLPKDQTAIFEFFGLTATDFRNYLILAISAPVNRPKSEGDSVEKWPRSAPAKG